MKLILILALLLPQLSRAAVTDGQAVNAAVTNAAFMDKNTATTFTVSKTDFQNTAQAASGDGSIKSEGGGYITKDWWVNGFNKALGGLEVKAVADAVSNGSNQDVTLTATYTIFTSVGLLSIENFAVTNRANATVIAIKNATTGTLTLKNLSGGTAANQIDTGTAADLPLSNGTSALLIYNTASSKWQVISPTSTSAGVLPIANGGTNSGTALVNFRFMISNAGQIVENAAVTGNRAVVTNVNGLPVASATTDTEIGFVSGVTSAIQTQLNGKQATGNYITALTGDVTASGPGSVAASVVRIQAIPVAATVPTTGQVLTYNGTAWAPATSSGFALTDLSNLSGVAVNTSLNPNTTNTRVIGTPSSQWLSVQSFRFNTINSPNAMVGGVLTSVVTGITGIGIAHVGLDNFPTLAQDPLFVTTVSNATANAIATADINIVTGNKTAGTGNSGNIVHTIGSSSGGTQGVFKSLKTGVASVVGQSWIASATDGTGYWAALNLATAAAVTGSLPIANGGTAGTTVATARTNLGIQSSATFLTSGTTYTTPASITTVTNFKITLIGAGGGGGGSNTSNQKSPGGGAGATCIVYLTGLNPSTGYTIQIGAGGAGGTNAGTNGSNGTATTTISINATTYTAGVGVGGTAGNSLNGGAGGTCTNTTINISGQAGGDSGGTLASTPGAGSGGSSQYGLGGASVYTAGAGLAGTGFGSGGSGGSGTGAGGNGAGGAILIELTN